MVGDAVYLRRQLHARLRGNGVAVCARQRFGLLAGIDVAFTDDLSLARQRKQHPEWAADTLAPVSLVQDPWLLDECADASVDFIVSFQFAGDPDRWPDGFAGAARVLVPGGRLFLADRVGDDALPGPAAAGRTVEAAAAGILAGHSLYDSAFTFDCVLSGGMEAIVGLKRRWPALCDGDLVHFEGAVFIVDRGCIRHVQSLEVLQMVRRPDQDLMEIDPRHFEQLEQRGGLAEGGARELLARTGRE